VSVIIKKLRNRADNVLHLDHAELMQAARIQTLVHIFSARRDLKREREERKRRMTISIVVVSSVQWAGIQGKGTTQWRHRASRRRRRRCRRHSLQHACRHHRDQSQQSFFFFSFFRSDRRVYHRFQILSRSLIVTSNLLPQLCHVHLVSLKGKRNQHSRVQLQIDCFVLRKFSRRYLYRILLLHLS